MKIPGEQSDEHKIPELPEIKTTVEEPVVEINIKDNSEPVVEISEIISNDQKEINIIPDNGNKNLVKISEEGSKYKKFFKMLKFGVPVPGVKNKMIQEGVDPDLLE